METLAPEDSFFGLLAENEGTGTAIVAAAVVAGAQLLRGSGIPVETMEPGSYVLVDFLNDRGIELMNQLDSDLDSLRGQPIGDWNLPELEGNGPTESLFDLTGKYEKRFVELCDAAEISSADRPALAVRTAALIIHRASPVMDSETGKSIVVQALVPACKTVPPPLSG